MQGGGNKKKKRGDEAIFFPRVVSRFFFERRNLCVFLFALFFIVKFTLIFSSGFLILLIFRNKIIHVTFSFGKFHFVHAFTSIPMQKGFTTEHSSELFRDSFEKLLNSS